MPLTYSDLFTLNPIETVIKIDQADQKSEAKRLVSRFILTPSLAEAIEHVALPQLDFDSAVEAKGLFVVGNYGTGKSHLLSVLSIIAEDASTVNFVQDESWRPKFATFAGNYRVKRCQIGGSMLNLYQIVKEQLEALAKSCGFAFTFLGQDQISNINTEFVRFMEAFEDVCPGKGVLLIVDELLRHLQTRDDKQLVLDLSTLQIIGEFCDGSRFAFMAGVQQSLFNSPQFAHIAQEINFVHQRYNDLKIDSKGISQLIEQYLYQKNVAQKEKIREMFLGQAHLFEVIGPRIDEFVNLFPAHPDFLREFERVFVVERREILKVLSIEGRALGARTVDRTAIDLVTSDKYWGHIERDNSLDADSNVRQIKKNVETLKTYINVEFKSSEDKAGAARLVGALAVNRLATPNIDDPIGLTPEFLKNNLLFKTQVAMDDAVFLTKAVKRLLDRTREAANGQYLAVADASGQYYIDPHRDVDYAEYVNNRAKTMEKDIVQRYVNKAITRLLEITNENAVKAGRLWNYELPWVDKNVERPGWLYFNFPNQRSTASPPKDFYIFLIESKRVTGRVDSMPQDNVDESYWFLEDFPPAKCESNSSVPDSAPDTFLDLVRKYAAAKELAGPCQPGKEKTAYESIAKRLLDKFLPDLHDHVGEWMSVEYMGHRKRLVDWVAQFDPSKLSAPFKSKLNAVSQSMFASAFDARYPEYPVFPFRITETTRKQNAQAALEILCEYGMVTANGKGVLAALGLYTGEAFTPDASPWLGKIRTRLAHLGAGQVLNQSDLFEKVDERWWFKGEVIEAEWVHVLLTAGARGGDLVLFGPGNTRYDAGNLRDFYTFVKSFDQIMRVGKPSELSFDRWKKLFSLFGVNLGLLADPNKHEQGIGHFNGKVIATIDDLVQRDQEIKGTLPFLTEAASAALTAHGASYLIAKESLETHLLPINTKAKMQNLKMDDAQIAELVERLRVGEALTALLQFLSAQKIQISAIERFEAILGDLAPEFTERLTSFRTALNAVYSDPATLADQNDALKATLTAAVNEALKAYRLLHKRYRLDHSGDSRKKKLTTSPLLKQLNRLALIRTLPAAKLEEIRRGFESLMACQGCSDPELLANAKSLCPKCGFDPRDVAFAGSALDYLEEAEQSVEALHSTWTQQLVKELSDPLVYVSIMALKQQESHLVTTLLREKALPADISDMFINAVNTALIGLKKKAIKSADFAQAVFGDGPMKPEELEARFHEWVKAQIGTDDKNTVRFVLDN